VQIWVAVLLPLPEPPVPVPPVPVPVPPVALPLPPQVVRMLQYWPIVRPATSGLLQMPPEMSPLVQAVTRQADTLDTSMMQPLQYATAHECKRPAQFGCIVISSKGLSLVVCQLQVGKEGA
jgi:hypothetical protein